jgi:hypothetical protein
MFLPMPNHIIGRDYDFSQLVAAYHADAQAETDAHYLLWQGEDILALCLRHKFNPEPGEVWVGDDQNVAEWGQKLAALKDKKTLPVYYARRGRKLYTFQGQHLITGDTDDPQELAKRGAPVPLSRIVFIKQLLERSL